MGTAGLIDALQLFTQAPKQETHKNTFISGIITNTIDKRIDFLFFVFSASSQEARFKKFFSFFFLRSKYCYYLFCVLSCSRSLSVTLICKYKHNSSLFVIELARKKGELNLLV